jgi:hypothetical protein
MQFGKEQDEMRLREQLDKIEAMLATLVEREMVKDHYEIEEFARIVGRQPFTCREWARLGRINADKKNSGRGPHARWVVSHDEVLRYQRSGLLPLRKLARDGDRRSDTPNAKPNIGR